MMSLIDSAVEISEKWSTDIFVASLTVLKLQPFFVVDIKAEWRLGAYDDTTG
jgi:hypothetical protein